MKYIKIFEGLKEEYGYSFFNKLNNEIRIYMSDLNFFGKIKIWVLDNSVFLNMTPDFIMDRPVYLEFQLRAHRKMWEDDMNSYAMTESEMEERLDKLKNYIKKKLEDFEVVFDDIIIKQEKNGYHWKTNFWSKIDFKKWVKRSDKGGLWDMTKEAKKFSLEEVEYYVTKDIQEKMDSNWFKILDIEKTFFEKVMLYLYQINNGNKNNHPFGISQKNPLFKEALIKIINDNIEIDNNLHIYSEYKDNIPDWVTNSPKIQYNRQIKANLWSMTKESIEEGSLSQKFIDTFNLCYIKKTVIYLGSGILLTYVPKEFVKDFAILYHSYDTNIHNILKKAEDVTYEITSEMITQIKEGVFYYVTHSVRNKIIEEPSLYNELLDKLKAAEFFAKSSAMKYAFDSLDYIITFTLPEYIRRSSKVGLMDLKERINWDVVKGDEYLKVTKEIKNNSEKYFLYTDIVKSFTKEFLEILTSLTAMEVIVEGAKDKGNIRLSKYVGGSFKYLPMLMVLCEWNYKIEPSNRKEALGWGNDYGKTLFNGKYKQFENEIRKLCKRFKEEYDLTDFYCKFSKDNFNEQYSISLSAEMDEPAYEEKILPFARADKSGLWGMTRESVSDILNKFIVYKNVSNDKFVGLVEEVKKKSIKIRDRWVWTQGNPTHFQCDPKEVIEVIDITEDGLSSFFERYPDEYSVDYMFEDFYNLLKGEQQQLFVDVLTKIIEKEIGYYKRIKVQTLIKNGLIEDKLPDYIKRSDRVNLWDIKNESWFKKSKEESKDLIATYEGANVGLCDFDGFMKESNEIFEDYYDKGEGDNRKLFIEKHGLDFQGFMYDYFKKRFNMPLAFFKYDTPSSIDRRRGFKGGLLNLKTENKYIRKYEVFKNI